MSKVTPYSKDAEFAKVDGHTVAAQTPGTKQVKQQFIRQMGGEPADIGFVGPARVYTQDYRIKDEDDATNQDIVRPFLGNPLVW